MSNIDSYKIILASNSPRRRELLAGLGYPFEVKVIKGIDESYPQSLDAYQVAGYISRKKAEAYRSLFDSEASKEETSCSSAHQKMLVITADTVVIVPAPAGDEQNDLGGNSAILGKPKNADDARRMLGLLSGKTHHVVTGVCLTTREAQKCFSVTTEVTFKNLSEEEIGYYVEQYKPFDKAGAYGIQEWIGYIGCTGLNGSYYNVMGLPVQRIYEELRKMQ